MQACIENATLPLLEPTSPPLERTRMPLRESASLPRIDNVPTWTIRVARPPAAHRNELAQELRGVPKAALRHVFGKIMGTHLWQLNRAIATAVPANSSAAPANAKPAPVAPISPLAAISPVAAISPSAPISDCEISSGLLRYLCAEAAATLLDRKRVAKSIALTVQFSGGESATVRQSLPQPASDPAALEAAARLALRRMRSNACVSLKLDVTAATAPCAATKTTDSAEAHVPLTAVA
jgi:nucleotidyltransferase/DNA polymerase involved in DNA repair